MKRRILHVDYNHFQCSFDWSKSHVRAITGTLVCGASFRKIMKIMKNRCSQNRSRLSLSITRDHWEILGSFPDDPGCIWVISGNFENFMIFMKFPCVPPEESASHPFSLYQRECPKFFPMIITPLPNSERKCGLQDQFSENIEKCRKITDPKIVPG